MELVSLIQESLYSILKLLLERLAFLDSNGTQLSPHNCQQSAEYYV